MEAPPSMTTVMRSNYEVLRKAYENDSSPVNWATIRAQRQDEGIATLDCLEKIEHARWELLKYIRDSPAEEEWASVCWASSEEALNMLMLCVKFDRANALHLMKLAHKDLECPRGFPWVDYENLDKLPANVEWKGTKMTRSSITKKYREFARHFEADEAFMIELDKLLQMELPTWLKQQQDV
jgi:hypothetical protein